MYFSSVQNIGDLCRTNNQNKHKPSEQTMHRLGNDVAEKSIFRRIILFRFYAKENRYKLQCNYWVKKCL